MADLSLPPDLFEARRTPRFGAADLPEPLAESHRTTVWATLHVQEGSVRYLDLEGVDPRDIRLEPEDSLVIAPDVAHQVEPSTDAVFYIQFYRAQDAPLVPVADPGSEQQRLLSGPWEPRHRDLDTTEEVVEMVTRQYVDVVQDDLLAPYFTFGPDFIDWQAHIGLVADYWCHVLLLAPDYEIDTIENHRHLHDEAPFTPELFDRWLQVFVDTVDGGWEGPNATQAKKRATGMAWAMSLRFLGKGAWRPAGQR